MSPKDLEIEPLEAHDELPAARTSRKNRHLAVLVVLVVGMFAFAYANAEFFVMVCQKIGILQPDAQNLRGEITETEGGRPIDVYFSGNVSDNLPIAFSVRESFQRTRVGARTINDYTFVNLSNRTIYFRPVHSVSPHKAGLDDTLILEKCFCFDEQKIEPGERYTLPVVYSFSNKLANTTFVIKMNYTLFPSTKEAYERSLAAPKKPSHSEPEVVTP
jgi:cytochrome c oxidase assembly protein subunit 11